MALQGKMGGGGGKSFRFGSKSIFCNGEDEKKEFGGEARRCAITKTQKAQKQRKTQTKKKNKKTTPWK